MKKSFMILAVLAMLALAMVSCKKDKDTDNGEKITIYATMDSPKAGGERTHLGPTTNNFTPTYWSTYDEVAVFSGSQMKEFELTGGENTSDATFAGEAPATNSAIGAVGNHRTIPIIESRVTVNRSPVGLAIRQGVSHSISAAGLGCREIGRTGIRIESTVGRISCRSLASESGIRRVLSTSQLEFFHLAA